MKQEISFYKMQGCGNDFVIVNYQNIITLELIRKMCTEKYGIGCDQFIILRYNSDNSDDLSVQIYNKDCSIALNCGNGMRCIGLLMNILYQKTCSNIQIINGNLVNTKIIKMYNDTSGLVYANLGKYIISSINSDCLVNIGNEHLIIKVDKIIDVDMSYGEYLSKIHNRNISFVQYMENSKAEILVFEKGAGLTKACGSAAAAVCIASNNLNDNNNIQNSNINNSIEMEIYFKNSGEKIVAGKKNGVAYIIAEAQLVFTGTFFM